MCWTTQFPTALAAVLSLNGVGAGREADNSPEITTKPLQAMDIQHLTIAPEHISRWDLLPRQRDALGGILRGWSSEEIAREFQIAEGTVKIHLAALFARFGARNRAELASRVKGIAR